MFRINDTSLIQKVSYPQLTFKHRADWQFQGIRVSRANEKML